MSKTKNKQPQLTDALLHIDDRIATLTFQRDDVRNALTGTALLDDLTSAIDWINHNDDISCLVLTGEGKAFCSGGNVKEMQNRSGMFEGDPATLTNNYRRGIQQATLAMYNLDVPAIAAVNGAAIGAGCDLACMCDIRLGSQHARFGETFINLGIIPGDGGAWFLQRLIGYQRAAELTFSGRIVEAHEALELGLLMEIVDAEQLQQRAKTLAQQFASKPPQALRMSKRLLKSAQRLELRDLLDLSASYQAACHHTAEHVQAVDSFLQSSVPDKSR